MRYEFADQIRVRYQHANGEYYDTWVSGEEALNRLESAAAEQRLRSAGKIDWKLIRQLTDQLAEKAKKVGTDYLQEWVEEKVDQTFGGNPIGNSIVDSVSRDDLLTESSDPAFQWRALLQDRVFKNQVLELAWIQLEGSFPDMDDSTPEEEWI